MNPTPLSVVDQDILENLNRKRDERRERIATACMAAIMVWRGDSTPALNAANAVEAADALIAALERSK